MIKNVKSIIPIIIAISMSAVIGWAFFGPPPSGVYSLSVALNNAGATTFTLHDLPTISDLDSNAIFQVFVSTGDGHFLFDTIANSSLGNPRTATLSKTYRYNSSGNYNPYAEITVAYDDNNPPPKRASGTINIPTGSSVSNDLIFTGWARLCANRRIVEGDSITYLVTYQNKDNCPTEVHGEIMLHFDTSKLVYKGAELYHSEYASSGAPPPNSSGVVRYTYLHLDAGQQRTAFFVFQTKEGNAIAPGDSLNPTPTLIFTHGNDRQEPQNPCNNAMDSLVHTASNTVVNGHDPNLKVANLQIICASDQYIEYMIRFQNEGTGPTDSVTISDYLCNLFPGNPQATMTGWYPIKPSHYGGTTRYQRFVFHDNGFQLRGLGEAGYGTAFDESATYGYVKFRVNLPPFLNRYDCQVIPNIADIVFDCNPPISTDLSLTPYGCKESCSPCTGKGPNTLPAFKAEGKPGEYFSSSAFMDNALQNEIKSQYQYFTWYPEIPGQNPDILLPAKFPLQNTTYTLIASSPGNCSYSIFQIAVNLSYCADLYLQVDANGLQAAPCQNSSQGYLHATVTGGTPPYTWHDCRKRRADEPFHLANLSPGKYYLGVTDRNGCTTEGWYEVKGPATPLFVDDDPSDCQADLKISGGQQPYTFTWTYNNTLQPSSSTSVLDLRNKTNVQVTVTDANNCTAIFKPKWPGNCPSPSSGSGWANIIWVLLGLVLSGGLLSYWLKKKKK